MDNHLHRCHGVTPTVSSRPKVSSGGGASKAYQNKKLDEYKKEIEYKKNLDQLSLNDEIRMYQHALDNYAKTTDEKRDLRVKLYELNKELAKKEQELIEKQTEELERAMEDQRNARGAAYDVREQTRDYNKIIELHRNYLHQVMQDTRLSYEERKEIYKDELETIREYEQQKRDLMVSSVDRTVSSLTAAIQKQIAELQKADEDAINANIKQVEEWRDKRIEAINAEYDARLEAIQRELDLLDQSEKEKTREEEDAEYERRKNRLQALIDYEHDATNRANYQKELEKLTAEYQKTLDKRALEDKKEALEAEKDLVKTQQDELISAIEDEASKRTEILNDQLTEVEQYYSERSEKAQEMAEQLLIDAKNNQDTILKLLKDYGDAYEITGQSLGEKLAQGINDGLANNITNVIQTIQDSIDKGIENRIKQLSSGSYDYAKDVGQMSGNKIINVTQNNSFEQMIEMPSETYRKLNNTSQELAAELAGM